MKTAVHHAGGTTQEAPAEPNVEEMPLRVVCPDVGTNCLGRALVLAELAAVRRRDVAIVGVLIGGEEVWPPATSSPVPIRYKRVRRRRDLLAARGWLRREVAGAQVVVSKPLATSLGLTLACGITPSRLLLDNDDWELGMKRSHGPQGVRARLRELTNPQSMNVYYSTRLFNTFIRRFPHRLCSNAWLAERFGGAVLPHVRDTAWLDPSRYDRVAARAKSGLGDERFWVGFIGTPRSHKGVDELVEAVLRAGEPVGLFLAGVDIRDPYAKELVPRAHAKLGDRLVVKPPFAFAELPQVLVACDATALPNRDDSSAWGQVPAKLFDAMAMGLPVVATDVGEAGRILATGDGRVVPAGDTGALASALTELATHRDATRALGVRARRRAERDFSKSEGQRILETLLDKLPTPRGRR